MTFAIISAVFGPLYGKPCWNAQSGYGSFMTMEFGEPSLLIDEPCPTSEERPDWLNKKLAKRRIHVRGDWHLWIYCCEWQVFTGSELIGDSDLKGSTKDRIRLAANELDGQILTRVTVAPPHGTSVFEFDLGSRLETKPYRESNQWMLFEPSGNVFTYGFDGRYRHRPGDTLHENEVWQSFETDYQG